MINVKKPAKTILIILGIIIVILGIMFCIDSNRMKQGKPVMFMTWGRKYAPVATINTKLGIVTSLEDEIK